MAKSKNNSGKKDNIVPLKKKNAVAPAKKDEKKLEKTTVMLRHEFSEAELKDKAQSLGEAIQKVASIEEEFSTIKKDYTKQLTQKHAEISELSNNVTQKYEMRNLSCFLHKNFPMKERQYLDHDGTILKTEPLTPADYQLAIDEA